MINLERKRERDKQWAKDHPEAKRAAAARYRATRQPGKATEYNREWRAKNIVVALLGSARRRAKRDGIAFDHEILHDLLGAGVPRLCPVYGFPLAVSHGARTDMSPTLDRIIPSEGYVRGNIQIISWLANRHKNDATAEQHEAIAHYMRTSSKNGWVSARVAP